MTSSPFCLFFGGGERKCFPTPSREHSIKFLSTAAAAARCSSTVPKLSLPVRQAPRRRSPSSTLDASLGSPRGGRFCPGAGRPRAARTESGSLGAGETRAGAGRRGRGRRDTHGGELGRTGRAGRGEAGRPAAPCGRAGPVRLPAQRAPAAGHAEHPGCAPERTAATWEPTLQ